MTAGNATPPVLQPDPLRVLRCVGGLRRLVGSYPSDHPMIAQKLAELEALVQLHLRSGPVLQIDVIHSEVHVDGVSFGRDQQANAQMIRELTDLGVDSIQIREGVEPREFQAVAEYLWQLKEAAGGEATEVQLKGRDVRHISLARLVPLDTSWRSQQWPDAPTGPLDPDYAQSLALAEQTFDTVALGKQLDPVTVRDLVQFLIYKVARSNAALGQILAVKQYENLTYCHSVNVSMLSLLIGKQIGLDEGQIAALVEAALLHDIGKTRVPLDVVKKPGALEKRERKMIEAHTTFGAEILVQTEGLRPLTPIVALEHHRGVNGTGYPDLGTAIPHVMSQIVSVADIYEAITGARTYQAPTLPERACLVLARLAGDKLNSALVKAFVNAITFFPLGSMVRTSLNEITVVVGINRADPLHPMLALVGEDGTGPGRRIDTSTRDAAGAYERHILETLLPPEPLDMTQYIAVAPAA
jgi:putative nucleotidyltransferase with HDIG domain